MNIEERCRNAIESLKKYHSQGQISSDDYYEMIALIGILPQMVQERNEFAERLKKEIVNNGVMTINL